MDQNPTSKNWENIPLDCLSLIFSNLGLDDLSVSVPFVSKSWYQASCQPILYKVINFHLIHPNQSSTLSKKFSSQFSNFFKLAISRSQGATFELKFSYLFPPSKEILSFASINCPRLKTLFLPRVNYGDEICFLNAIKNWGDLECLEFESVPHNLGEIARQVGICCKNFNGLKICGFIEMNDVNAIVKFLPKIGVLDLSGSRIGRKEFLGIIDGCKELKKLSLNRCVGLEIDSELKERVKGIEEFDFYGCRLNHGVRKLKFRAEDWPQVFVYYQDCVEMGMF